MSQVLLMQAKNMSLTCVLQLLAASSASAF